MNSGFEIAKASHGGADTKTRSDKEMAVDVGRFALGELGNGEGYQLMTKRAPVSHQLPRQKHDLVPRAIDREGAGAFHHSTTGIDQSSKCLINRTSRISLEDARTGVSPTSGFNDVLLR
ncbi:MAG: hypothetical protein GY809_19950 [Planctomycetes bacterium]|nr:hypothetical protein [Planctomycetota bacterium]